MVVILTSVKPKHEQGAGIGGIVASTGVVGHLVGAESDCCALSVAVVPAHNSLGDGYDRGNDRCEVAGAVGGTEIIITKSSFATHGSQAGVVGAEPPLPPQGVARAPLTMAACSQRQGDRRSIACRRIKKLLVLKNGGDRSNEVENLWL